MTSFGILVSVFVFVILAIGAGVLALGIAFDDSGFEGMKSQEEPEPYWTRWDCSYISSQAADLSWDGNSAIAITKIYRLMETTTTTNLRECKGWASWTDGSNTPITIWAEEQPSGDVMYGFNETPNR